LQAGFGNVFIGQTSDQETAKLASEIIGKEKNNRKNVSAGHDVSVSLNEHLEYVIHPHEMALLNQGEFVGKVSDPMTSDDTSEKRFLGKFFVDKPSWYSNPDPMPKILSFPDLSEEDEMKKIDELLTANQLRIKNDIRTLVNKEYWKLKIRKFLISGGPYTQAFYNDQLNAGTLNETLSFYANEAEKVHEAFSSNPAITGDLNAKTLGAVTEKIMSDIHSFQSHSQPGDDNEPEESLADFSDLDEIDGTLN
jgi:hypothetical protein